MAETSANVEQHLRVGLIVMLHTDPARKNSPRFRSVLRGWRQNVHLILDRPRDRQGAFAVLHERQPCVVRFIYEGVAYAFDSQVLSWDAQRQNPYLRMRWPSEVSSAPFRKCERLNIRLACRWTCEGSPQRKAVVDDLSVGGCGLLVPEPIAVDQQLQLWIQLPDAAVIEGINAVVRNVREAPEGYRIGCEFVGRQEVLKNDIGFFVSTTAARRRTEPQVQNGKFTVLVMDEHEANFRALRARFEDFDVETIWANNVVDGFYRLRMTVPSAVVVSQSLPDITGIDVCRAIRSVQSLQRLPLFLYGGEAPELPALAKELGVQAYYPEKQKMLDDVSFGISARLGEKRRLI